MDDHQIRLAQTIWRKGMAKVNPKSYIDALMHIHVHGRERGRERMNVGEYFSAHGSHTNCVQEPTL